MKYFLLLSISFFSLHCFAQSDSVETKHEHRVWIDPLQIVTGQYRVAYCWHHGKGWYEAGAGYQFFPFTRALNERNYAPNGGYYAPGSFFATPTFGLLFYGPVASFAYDEYDLKVNKNLLKAAKKDSSIQKKVENLKRLNSIRYEVQYQFLQHKPACYYGGEQNYAYTYSSVKSAVAFKILWSRILPSHSHLISQVYIGPGLQVAFGSKTKYVDTAMYQGGGGYGGYDLCVSNINSSTIIKTTTDYSYIIPWLHFGIRLGFQYNLRRKRYE